MTTPNPGQGPAPLSASLRGAVDLSALKRPRPPAPAAQDAAGGGAEAAGYIVEANQETFSALIQLSGRVPVIVELTASFSDIAAQLSQVMETVAREFAGRFVL